MIQVFYVMNRQTLFHNMVTDMPHPAIKATCTIMPRCSIEDKIVTKPTESLGRQLHLEVFSSYVINPVIGIIRIECYIAFSNRNEFTRQTALFMLNGIGFGNYCGGCIF